MLSQAIILIAIGAAACSTVMIVLWFIQRRTGNAAIVDVGWTGNLFLLAFLYALLVSTGVVGDGLGGLPAWLLAVLVAAWAARLGGHLFKSRIWKQEEEGRYVQLRKDWAPNVQRAFFLFYQAQAALDVFLSLPFLLVALDPDPAFGAWEIAGTVLFIIGWIGEFFADRQLDQFKRDPDTKGKTCRRGLWGWSRHPNYFFEVMIWTGWAVFACGAPLGWLAFLCPAAILFFIFRITGIPATEEQALRSRGDDYRRYQQEVSVFIPLPPKKSA